MPFLYRSLPRWRLPFLAIDRLAFNEACACHALRDSRAFALSVRGEGATTDVQHGVLGEHNHFSIMGVPMRFFRRACGAEAAVPLNSILRSLAPWTSLDGGALLAFVLRVFFANRWSSPCPHRVRTARTHI